MARKTRPNIHIKGGVHAKHDVIMGDQTNNYQIANIQSPRQFTLALEEVKAEIQKLKQSGELSKPVQANLEAAEAKVAEAEEEAAKPQPVGEEIKAALNEAKEYIDLITGSIQSAVTLGTTLGGLALLAIKLFGG